MALRWIDTGGGPHLLLEKELVPNWRGVEGWWDHTDPKDKSDCACRVDDRAGLVSCGWGYGLVLGDHPASTAWLENSPASGGRLVRWIAADNDQAVVEFVGQERWLNSLPDELTQFDVTGSGVMLLFDSAIPADELEPDDYFEFQLSPGRYTIASRFVDTERLMIVIHDVILAS